MKFLYAAILCLVLWQCKKSETGEIVPEPAHNADKPALNPLPAMISAPNSLGLDVAMDNADNVYVSGSFYGTTEFGTAVGGNDVFIAKYKPNGELEWSRTLGGPKSDEGRGIAVDGSGNVYVTGDFYGTLTSGDIAITSHGDADAFIVKYNTQGEFQWIRAYGSDGGERGQAIAVDMNGNAYATGEYQGTGVFGNTSKQSAGEFDAFIVKYSTDGAFEWVQSGGGASRDTGYGITTDKRTGEVYVTGFFMGTTTFGNTSVTSKGTLPGEGDVFLAKYNSQGEFVWMKAFGGDVSSGGFDVAVDGSGNIFALKNGAPGGSLVKLDAAGNMLWEQILKFDGSGTAVDVDKSGNAYVVKLGSAILKYNSDGIIQQAQLPRSSESIIGTGIAVNPNGKLFISGYYKGTLTYGGMARNDAGWVNMFAIGGDF
ncbi:SBBP repeat-containing protein [Dyadobacter fermentans]|nr:SBBP repeat-containing protein [Dyadobacter fermentans]